MLQRNLNNKGNPKDINKILRNSNTPWISHTLYFLKNLSDRFWVNSFLSMPPLRTERYTLTKCRQYRGYD